MRFKRFQRFLALATGLCLAAVTAAAPAWAAGASPDSPDPYALEAPVTGAPLLAGARTGTVVDEGYCGAEGEGKNLAWTLTKDAADQLYILTISGSGAMADYPNGNTPWSGPRGTIKTLVLSEGLTSIGEKAFTGCTKLASVTIPGGVKTIGSFAFENCPKLASVTLPDSLVSIGDRAFQGCTTLASVTIPRGVETIKNSAFYNCGLTELVLPEGVKSIGESAFAGCESLDSVAIPSSVTEIAPDAFSGCPALKTFTVDPGNTAYSFQNGLLLSGDGKELFALLIPPEDGTLTVPDGVEIIGDSAFEDRGGLTSVIFPDSLTAIGNDAFYGCTGLTAVSLPDSLTSIGDGAFFYCTGLSSVTLPASLTAIGDNAFLGCTGLTSVALPDSLKTIGSYAFYGCTGLISVTLPASLTSIGERAFEGCESLETVVYNGSKEALETLCGGNLTAAGFAEAQTFSYPVAIEENGGTEAKGAGIYKCGADVALTAGTKTGHTFAGWAVDGVTLPQEELQAETLTFTMPDGPVTASVQWTVNSYAVAVENGGDGSSVTEDHDYDTPVTLNAGTRTGYTFDRWTVDGTVPADLSDTSQPKLTFTMPDGPVTVTANWTVNFYDVTVENGGTATESHAYGASVTVAAGTREGYTFTGWTVTGVEGLTEDQRKAETLNFPMPDGDVTVSANWTVNTYPVTVENGGTEASGAGTYDYGKTVTLNAGTKTGHTFTGWTVEGVTLTEAQRKANPLTFPMPAGPVTASANWKQNVPEDPGPETPPLPTVEITAPPAPGGSVSSVTVAPESIADILPASGKLPAVFTANFSGPQAADAGKGTLDSDTGEITFTAPLSIGGKLFFLDPDTLIPLAKPVTLK